nr:hypothetical protein [Tanacetum cinerariifolium]
MYDLSCVLYNGLPIQLVAPPSPDYVPGPEHPPSPDYVPGPKHPPSPVEIPYVPEPEYPKYLAPSDDEASLEDQPLPADASPTATSPGYEDKEEDEEEHLALVDSSAVPIVDHTCLRRARKTVRLEPSMSASMETCIARLAALLSPPLHVPSPPLPFPSPLTTSLTDTGAPLGYRAAEIRMRALLLSTSRMTDIPKANLGPIEYDLRRYRVEQAGYGIIDTWDEMVDTLIQIDPTTLERVDQRVAELDTTVRQMTDEPDHRRTTMLLDREAMYAREAWVGFEDRSAPVATRVRTLEVRVPALIAHTSSLQTQLTTTLGRIEILKASDPEPQEGPVEAGIS